MVRLLFSAVLVSVLTVASSGLNPVLGEEHPEFIELIDIFSEDGIRRVKPDWDEIEKHPLGTEGNPVRCEMPDGEHAYLNRLICTDGSHPTYSRIGSVGQSPYGQIMDAYGLTCAMPDRSGRYTIYMDMYHAGYDEVRPIPGFEIEPIVQY